jgi:hypothetical protein
MFAYALLRPRLQERSSVLRGHVQGARERLRELLSENVVFTRRRALASPPAFAPSVESLTFSTV